MSPEWLPMPWLWAMVGALLAAGCQMVPLPLVDRSVDREVPSAPVGMVKVDAGAFVMGHGPDDGRVGIDVGVDSLPRHTVTLPVFWIDRTEVTVADYQVFWEATQAEPFSRWPYADGDPRPDEPVSGVSHPLAEAYCEWRGKRLPSEAEWEKAARGTDGRLYPWGDTWDPTRVVAYNRSRTRPEPVGSHPDNRSPYGALDMSGNVMEWTSSWYDAHPGSRLQRQAFGTQYRVLKGGGWDSALLMLRAASRHAIVPEIGQPDFGFRCALAGAAS